ncbi:hypothetical protein EVAR_86974_1 [Eumeta japonica]|uniref:Uncharacterized protein n=1 Tax=Eumeta variegata TaxID=151549 RepID=A0A4C1W6N3_EUMVA|nr:hypothetical protein EVAR_86974_1 [Eumeta japonica]
MGTVTDNGIRIENGTGNRIENGTRIRIKNENELRLPWVVIKNEEVYSLSTLVELWAMTRRPNHPRESAERRLSGQRAPPRGGGGTMHMQWPAYVRADR